MVVSLKMVDTFFSCKEIPAIVKPTCGFPKVILWKMYDFLLSSALKIVIVLAFSRSYNKNERGSECLD